MKFNQTVEPVSRDRLFSDPELTRGMIFCRDHEHILFWQDKCFMFRFALGTGLRVSEIVALRVPEDCGADGFVWIRKSKSGRQRMVKVTPELRPYYLARIQRLQGQKLFPGITTTRTLERWLDLLLEGSGIPKKRGRGMHGLRHSYATWEMATQRLNWVELAMQLGHKDPTCTMQVYAHSISEFMYEEERIPKWWTTATESQKLREVKSEFAQR